MPPSTITVDISVVIVAWNARHYLELCLESIAKAPPRRSMEVLVVDNASADDTIEMVEAKYPWVTLIKSKENLGFARGNNVAIRQCRGHYIALVNPDVILFPDCLDTLADFLDQNPKVGNVGPRVFNPDMTQQSTCRRFPSLWNNFCSATHLQSIFKGRRFFAGEHMFYFPHDRILAVDVIVGCFSMIRREAFDSVGLLDEDLFMYGDDVDWCRRAWKAGWQVIFYPEARAIHDQGKTTAPFPVHFAVAQQRSVLRYWTKHHRFLGVLGIRSIILFHHLLRYLIATLSSHTLSRKVPQTEVRIRVSSACLRQLLYGSVPSKPEEQPAS
jgi:GT2 family glycosyltransferase